MPEFSTRNCIVEKADTLFYESGFEATSFADIAAAVGISRGNFYHHFKSKDDILDAVITLRIDRTRALLDRWQDDADTPSERILSFIHMLIGNRAKIMAFGCPVGTLCSELAKLDHVAQTRAAAILRLFRDWLSTQFQALGAGDRSDAWALHLLSWSQGVAVMATAFRDEAFIHREVAGIARWLTALPDLSQPH
ncbi:TetR/AcrR family transcriptional regulator [Sphingomonas sanguinis]|uniref:Transcriptional regulator n=1 Tax=Sphingomonas sanguinis TaxID=33051 RepID=A0A147JAB0_9SPHN|nr:TetR/AcrR family transcriptional regulator [Sphingomonas sanguinis]KTW14447.1 transcriptional regulator [Sphingomonas sanguinis]